MTNVSKSSGSSQEGKGKDDQYVDRDTAEDIQSLVAETGVTTKRPLGEDLPKQRLESVDAERINQSQDLTSFVQKMLDDAKATNKKLCSMANSITAYKGRKVQLIDRSRLEAFPLLMTSIETNYRACTIPYRLPSDDPKMPTPTELAWINLFANSIPSFQELAGSDDSVPDAPAKAEKFAQRYSEILEDLKKDPEILGGPPDCVLLYKLREHALRELGFRDIFKKVKDEENAKAISLFEDVVHQNDAIEDTSKRVENLIRGIFAGSIFDLGSGQRAEAFPKDGMSFLASCQNLVPRPWVIDDLEAFISKWNKKTWKKAVIFVGNSGADLILGILPFARELLRCGTQVVLAANKLPSINDVTYSELNQILSKLKDENGKLAGMNTSNLLIVSSGNDLPVINLTSTSQELSYFAGDADLVIFEGMGRGIETNLYAQFKCDSLKIGMVKHIEVAQFLGGRLNDCVFKYTEV